jgi:outer membrane lipoprotein SlyB
MKTDLKKRIAPPAIGLSLLSLTAAGCGTITGATIGGATGAGIGAATHHSVEKSAIIGAGVGGAAGALYDIYSYTRRDGRDDDRRD